MQMKLACLLIAVAVISVSDGPHASAFPVYGYGPPPLPPRYFYRFGPYGFRRGLPNGTGYRGRGSFTGGPAGGLPSRN